MKKLLSATLIILLLASCATKTSLQPTQPHSAPKNIPEPELIARAIPHYQQLEHEAWPTITYQKTIKPGQRNQNIPLIRQRLAQLGDLASSAQNNSTRYDNQLVKAVKHYQARHGLTANGLINKATVTQLNVTPAKRVHELMASYQGWNQLPNSDSPFIQVNLPSYELNVIQNNQSLLNMRVVIGKPSWATPPINSQLKTIVLHPTWNVPSSIAKKTVIPAVIANPAYLESAKIKVMSSWDRNAKEIHPSTITWSDYLGEKKLPFRLMQIPGEHNAMGQVKFLFPNKHSIYLHDTPAKNYFSRSNRALSHGCIRLEKPMALLEYLLEHNTNLSKDEAIERIANPKEQYVHLNKPIPIYLTYMTSWVESDGTVEFRPDIYNKY